MRRNSYRKQKTSKSQTKTDQLFKKKKKKVKLKEFENEERHVTEKLQIEELAESKRKLKISFENNENEQIRQSCMVENGIKVCVNQMKDNNKKDEKSESKNQMRMEVDGDGFLIRSTK